MQIIYCKVELGLLSQPIYFLDSEAPDFQQIASAPINQLAYAMVQCCAQLGVDKIQLDGSKMFNSAIVAKIKELDPENKLSFVEVC